MSTPGATESAEPTVPQQKFSRRTVTDRTGRSTARLVGGLFIVGTLAGIVSGVFVEPYLTPGTDAGPYLSHVADGGMQLMIGAALVFVMGISLAVIPVLMYPILTRYSERVAIGYLVFRGALEFVLYLALMGIVLTILTLSQRAPADGTAVASTFESVRTLLVAYDVVYYVLLTIIFALGAVLFYLALYRTALIPRWLAGWGLLAALLWLTWGVSGIFGLIDPASTLQIGIALPTESAFALPIALQEMVMALWLIVRGFDHDAFESLDLVDPATAP